MGSMMIITLQVLTLLGVGCIFLFKDYLFTYSKSKAKNLATKEDISEITNKIEEVKLDYAIKLEGTKADLSAQISNSSHRYEKEFEIMSEITEKLVTLRDKACLLRPALDYVDTSKTEDEIKRERLIEFHNAGRELYLAREYRRPFYPEDIYLAIKEVEDIAHLESVQYKWSDPYPENKPLDYWDKAQQNQNAIVAKADSALKLIRDRVIKWESV